MTIASMRRPAREEPGHAPGRILVVDDDRKALDVMQRVLHGRYDVVTASGGHAALDALDRSSFAVILSDLQMPEMDGIELLAAARDRSPDTVRILLSGRADLPAAIRAINDGQLFRFLLKPCESVPLLAALRDATEQHRLDVTPET